MFDEGVCIYNFDIGIVLVALIIIVACVLIVRRAKK